MLKHLCLIVGILLAMIFAPTADGDITYTLNFDPASSPEAQQVANSVAAAAALYNLHGSFNKHWSVFHDPGIPTAQANYSGYMGFGGQRTVRVAMHEAAHTFGMGTTAAYANLVAGGVWQGQYGNRAQFETYNDFGDGLHGDGHAIWPGGFNFENEDGFIERIWHIRIMAAIRADMGIMAFTEEAENDLVHPGETAEFRVEAPQATGYQWLKDGVALTNGGDISGATGAILRIANAGTADEGAYRCAATGAGETLDSRPRQLWVRPKEVLGLWAMNGNVRDSAKGNHGTAFGSPGYAAGKVGTAIVLDGADDYIELPDAVGLAEDITVATWVNWNGGGDWQRIFDLGTGIYQNVFLTPRSGDGTMRLAFKDSINGVDAEFRIDAPTLPTGQWVHVAAVLKGGQATLYVNGQAVGSIFDVPVDLTHFPPTQNYIGRSQYPDPRFNGRIDDFRIYNHALGGSEIWDLWGQSANRAPEFESDVIMVADANLSDPYSGSTLADRADDADLDALTFTKLHGPAWLVVAADGSLSGVPASTDSGTNTFVVRVEDPSGASSDAELQIKVLGTVAYWNFEDGAPNTHVAYGPANPGQYDGSILDQSGAGNHLSAWDEGWHWYRPVVPGATTPQTGAANHLSIENANSFPAISAIGTSLTAWSPTEWTIEAAIRPNDATNGFQTFVGRDSRGAHPGNRALAALYFAVTPNGGLRINFTDAGGGLWEFTSVAGTIQDGSWHAVAATSDGESLSLYLKNITDGDPDYMLLGTLDISASADPALSTGTGDGADWDAGVFTVARGLFDGGHTDRFLGHIDDVRLTAGALAPAAFLYNDPPGSLTPAEEWRLTHFDTADNSGLAADDVDPDEDGIVNLLERAFGGDPNVGDPGVLPAVDSEAPLLSIIYREVIGTELELVVQESTRLGLEVGEWEAATGSSAVLSDDGVVRIIRFTAPAAEGGRKFLRLRVTEAF